MYGSTPIIVVSVIKDFRLACLSYLKMLKLMYFIFLISFIVKFLILRCASFSCVHDQIVEQKRPTLLRRSIKYQNVREQRDKDPKLFEPLRIHFYVDNFDTKLSANAIHNIELALKRASNYIAETFKVYKRRKPFVLERQICPQRWQSGPNKGKCSKLVNGPENCISQEITYSIPQRFLDKIELYDYDGKNPQYEIPSGSGLKDSNFITFVTSESSSICEQLDASAFGTYCRVDRKTNEPLAGILNLCPSYFIRKVYPSDHYYNVILHEMFHILGFSIHLFEKFLPCIKGVRCNIPKNIIQNDSYGVPRLMFPLVIKHMQEHFSCSDSDFGGPMVVEVTNSTEDEEEDETEQYTSHWDPILMYSSVMISKFAEYDQMFVDNITLSVFESSGWYIMNYSQADNFRFGKDQGCEFGVNTTCSDSPFLCDPNEEKLGCDLTHKSIGKCTELSPQRNCGVYQPYSKESCEINLEKQHGLDFYALGYKPKCFMLSEGENSTEASCLPVKCKKNATYSILINMTWYDCFSEEMINLKNVSLFCPESSLFCPEDISNKIMEPQPYCPKDETFFIAVRMYLSLPTFKDLHKSEGFKSLKVSTLKGIAEQIDIPVNFIVNSSLTVFKKIWMDFIICPNPSLPPNKLSKIIFRVQNFLDNSSFLNILSSNMIAASFDVKVDSRNLVKFSDHEGFRTLILFPVLCAIFLAATIVASLMRSFFFRKR